MYKNKSGYSIIIVIILIWFMILLTGGVFRLVMNEMKDNVSIGNYIKAYFGAESAQELALLEIKKQWYGFNEGLQSSNILVGNKKNNMQIPKIQYTNNGKTKVYTGSIEPLQYNIMPLFYIDKSGETKITDYTLHIINGNKQELSWNIVGKESGISGTGVNTEKWDEKSLVAGNISYIPEVNVSNFLSDSNTNYLILFNNSSANIEYEIRSSGFFTRPVIQVISSATVGDYKQNLKTIINYADIVNRANYSIYSSNSDS